MREKVYSLLGFAARMRKLSFGKERLRAYMRSGRKRKLVIVAEDASERTRMDLEIRAQRTSTRLVSLFTKKQLGKLLGKNEVSAVAIEDDSIIDGVERYIGGG